MKLKAPGFDGCVGLHHPCRRLVVARGTVGAVLTDNEEWKEGIDNDPIGHERLGVVVGVLLSQTPLSLKGVDLLLGY